MGFEQMRYPFSVLSDVYRGGGGEIRKRRIAA
jgi:hypothetical protein